MQRSALDATVAMLRRVMPWLAATLVTATAVAQGNAQTPARDIAIVGASIIDVVAGKSIADQTIIVRGPHILSIGARRETSVPPGALVVDGTGKYVMPGLWDMHGHLFQNAGHPGTDEHRTQFPLYLANGVTGVRDMWTNLEELPVVRGWNDDAAAGRLMAPRISPTGPMIDGPGGILPHVAIITSAVDARRVADSVAAGGARALKIHGAVSRDAFFALAARSKEIRVPLIGHVPAAVAVREAIAAGQTDIEHNGASDGCATSEAEAEAMRLRVDKTQHPPPGKVQQLLLDAYDEQRCSDLLTQLVQRHIWVTPTLVAAQYRLVPTDPTISNRDELRYVAAADRAAWTASRNAGLGRAAPAEAETRRQVFAAQVRLVGAMQRAGVSLMVGTDVTNNWLVTGFSVHDELALFVRSGMTTAEALRAATITPAKYLGAIDSLGTVGPGKAADLVLLDADPLLDIGNTKKIRAVFIRGRYLDRAALDALLLGVATSGRSSSP